MQKHNWTDITCNDVHSINICVRMIISKKRNKRLRGFPVKERREDYDCKL